MFLIDVPQISDGSGGVVTAGGDSLNPASRGALAQ